MAVEEGATLQAVAPITLDREAARDWQGLGRTDQSAPGYWHRAWRRFRRNRVAMVALVITALILLFCLAAPLISEYVTRLQLFREQSDRGPGRTR